MGGSSAKRKREKKKDFEKPKLKVGKTKPKASNATDTSFRAKAITLAHQSLSASAPSASTQFVRNLSLLTSKSDSQRKDALSSLHHALSAVQSQRQRVAIQKTQTGDTVGAVGADDVEDGLADLPRPASDIITQLRPLLLDASKAIRNLTLQCLECLDPTDVAPNAELLTIYMHIGLTHLAADIRATAASTLEWMVSVAGEALVTSRGGWTGTLGRVIAALGWTDNAAVAKSNGTSTQSPTAHAASTPPTPQPGWTHTARTKLEDPKVRARHMLVLAQLLDCGLRRPLDSHVQAQRCLRMAACFPLRDADAHRVLGTAADPYARLALFSDGSDETGDGADDAAAIGDAHGRWEAYRARYGGAVDRGVAEARKEGGEVGRAAKAVERALATARPPPL